MPAHPPRSEARVSPPRDAAGVTLAEILLALALLGILAAAAAHGSGAIDALSLHRSADLAHGHLVRARLEALARREKVAVWSRGPGRLLLVGAAGRTLAEVDLGGEGLLALDSLRLRPSVIRYNPRGHGSAGTVTLYRGHRGIRLVVNFVGRVRRHAFRH